MAYCFPAVFIRLARFIPVRPSTGEAEVVSAAN
jgi:hypothetical protein